jgi:hypothetical protein
MSHVVSEMERLLQSLSGSGEADGAFPDTLTRLVLAKNRENASRFLATPFSERLVLLPQCLRSTKACKAEERGYEYLCQGCGACKVAAIVERAEELGYRGVKILKGGSALAELVRTLRPTAVLGVCCPIEGATGILACERVGVVAFCVPLLRAGCADTDVDLADVMSVLGALVP